MAVCLAGCGELNHELEALHEVYQSKQAAQMTRGVKANFGAGHKDMMSGNMHVNLPCQLICRVP